MAYPSPTLDTKQAAEATAQALTTRLDKCEAAGAAVGPLLRQLRTHTYIIAAAAKGKSEAAMQRAWYISIDEKGDF